MKYKLSISGGLLQVNSQEVLELVVVDVLEQLLLRLKSILENYWLVKGRTQILQSLFLWIIIYLLRSMLYTSNSRTINTWTIRIKILYLLVQGLIFVEVVGLNGFQLFWGWSIRWKILLRITNRRKLLLRMKTIFYLPINIPIITLS